MQKCLSLPARCQLLGLCGTGNVNIQAALSEAPTTTMALTCTIQGTWKKPTNPTQKKPIDQAEQNTCRPVAAQT